jgi:hypothetical protein
MMLLLTLLLASSVAVQGQQDCWTNNCTDPITLVPAPWTIYGTGYAIPLLPVLPGELPLKTYGPLERTSSEATAGIYTGLAGAIQIIRYTDTPVGPYDEFVIIPGAFTYDRLGSPRTNLRVTRMYVSQKYTCYNGRASKSSIPPIFLFFILNSGPIVDWNIPKHLARFDWTDNADGSTGVAIYPYDTTGDADESYPASAPFFQATISAPVLDVVPVDFGALLPGGVPVTLGQPPLPTGNSSYGELPGTDVWGETVLSLVETTPGVVLVDLDQGDGDVVPGEDTNAVGDEFFQNFWPTVGRYNTGVQLGNFTIIFSPEESWN